MKKYFLVLFIFWSSLLWGHGGKTTENDGWHNDNTDGGWHIHDVKLYSSAHPDADLEELPIDSDENRKWKDKNAPAKPPKKGKKKTRLLPWQMF